MKKTIYISVAVVLVIIIGLVVFNKLTAPEDFTQIEVDVKRGQFQILVTVTGELQAENSTQIMAPSELRSRNLRFSQLRIQDLIPEGTIVDSGDFVAQLDKAEADNSLKDAMDRLEQSASALLKTKLDTTIQLRNLRDELINLKYNMEEMEITLDQSKFEPPATIRQAQINLDKATRAYDQAVKNYELKVRQSQADMREAEIDLSRRQRTLDEMNKVLNQFTIYAPASGMVIYQKEHNGQKRTVGSNISPWDLTVATLPDLSSMISKTYVNEIDVSKLRVGQKVTIGVDAFPERSYTGVVTQVANIGEQLPNTDAKVFEVIINMNETDPILRPSMTTSNQIITTTYDDILFVPLEAVHTEDSIPVIYTKSGHKQVVVLGESNENEIIVEMGLEEGEKILLTTPEDPEKFKLRGEELVEIIAERLEQKRLEEEAMREEASRRAAEREIRMRQFRSMPEGQDPGRQGQIRQQGDQPPPQGDQSRQQDDRSLQQSDQTPHQEGQSSETGGERGGNQTQDKK
ncbi:MAG: efflux RND transporter periplasmic adaptor subunit [Bacteroidales bacterium]|nr:MAG: efflux RND transporter periplasmic adaptor subunit [Bacteroidales bacterium]